MPDCPHCKAKVHTLIETTRQWTSTTVGLMNDGTVGAIGEAEIDEPSFDDESHYHCPECGEQIAHSFEEATKFIMEEKL